MAEANEQIDAFELAKRNFPQGDHYGPVSIGKPDQRVEKLCARWGKRIAELTKKLGH